MELVDEEDEAKAQRSQEQGSVQVFPVWNGWSQQGKVQEAHQRRR
jgi:hypothetical protein